MIATLISGLLLGGLYCLFALGQALVFGVMRMTNTAHGDLIVLMAFAAIGLAGVLGVHWSVAALLLVPLSFAVGYGLQRLVLNATLTSAGRDPMPSLVVTFGIGMMVQNALLEFFSADPRSLDSAGLNTLSVALPAGMVVGALPLATLVFAVAMTAALQWLFARTTLGRSFRAVSDDREMAQALGLDSARVYAIATGIAFVLIAAAGVLQAMRTTVAPTDGAQLLLFSFEAVVIGGMGSFWGTFIGAELLGVAQQIGFSIDPGSGIWLGHVMFLAILAVRPQGLLALTRG